MKELIMGIALVTTGVIFLLITSITAVIKCYDKRTPDAYSSKGGSVALCLMWFAVASFGLLLVASSVMYVQGPNEYILVRSPYGERINIIYPQGEYIVHVKEPWEEAVILADYSYKGEISPYQAK